MNLRIVTDSSSDYTREQAATLKIDVVPLILTFDGNDYKDGIDLSKEAFYDYLINQKKYPKTSQPSPEQFVEIFKDAQEKEETVLVLPIAKSLSGTYNAAMIAREIVGYAKIYIVDSCTTIAGLQILVEEALKKNQEGCSIEEILQVIEQLKKKIVVVACMDTLEYLSKGGRLSTMEAFLGNLVNIKPIIKFKEDGSIGILARPFGRIRANRALLNFYKENPADKKYKLYYYYSYEKSNLDVLVDKMKHEELYQEGEYVNLSPAVGSHIGGNAYALVYVKEG